MTHNLTESTMIDQRRTAAETEAMHRDNVLIDASDVDPEHYPRLTNMSAGLLYKAVLRAEEPERPEYVTVPMGDELGDEVAVAVAQWNMLWEAAQFRRRIFDEDDLPPLIAGIADRGDTNVVFVPRTRTRYYEYAPLVHLLTPQTLQRHGLPLLRCGRWPFLAEATDIDRFVPFDFEDRLSRAWASTVWRHLVPGSKMRGFTGDDPIRLLAHNLDFWIPPVTEVIQETLRELPEVDNGAGGELARFTDGSVLEGAVVANPRIGSDVWRGEVEAAETVRWTVEEADKTGRLRAILEAVRSNRIEDDFSDHWTYAREDFERTLYRKRSKIKVRFVELTDTIPVHGPETEVENRVLFGDFMALLDERDRQIVVVLRSGTTKLTEVAEILGYANHSAVSKRLAQIRKQAEAFFGED